MEKNRSDTDLIQDYLRGDEDALKLVVNKYVKPIYNFCYQYLSNAQDAEDATQEVFVKAWKHLRKFDLQKSFKTWLFKIAQNTALDLLKKKRTIPFAAFQDDQGENILLKNLADIAPFPDELMKRADLVKILNDAINSLSPIYRVVLFLYYHDGFNFREIAEALDESLDTVKSRHRRALVMLKKTIIELP